MATKSNVRSAKAKSAGNLSFHGWRRQNKRVGVRNHVVILPLDDLSNAACEAVAHNVKGTFRDMPEITKLLQVLTSLELP